MKRIHIGCAVPDCRSFLVFENETGSLDTRLLTINSWRIDHGRWICGWHDGFALQVPKDARELLLGADLTMRHPEGYGERD